jgi:polyhydroxybutyrate depolymerase
MLKHFLSSLLLLSLSTAHSQLISDSVLIEGHYRSFHYYKPVASKKGGSLLFILHGSGGSGTTIRKATGQLEAIAAKENLLIVYPDGYKNYWNECRRYATSAANKENINEQAFFTAMISQLQKKYGILPENVYAAGFSGGGHMAYKLALTMPLQINAVAAIVANLPDSSSSDCTAAAQPVPVLIINGTQDEVNPYNGGEMFVNNASYGVVRSTDNTFHYWATRAGYTGQPEKIALPDADPADGKTIEQYRYNASGKPQVTLLKVIGGKHDYPNDIDVYRTAWEFCKAQQQKIHEADADKQTLLVETACGECKLGLPGKSCDLAVRINGQAYFVDGTNIDAHGDAHAADGFCNSIRQAQVQGQVINNRFHATYFQLQSSKK